MAASIYVTKDFFRYNMCTVNFESGFSQFSLILFLLFLASFYFSHFLSSSDRIRFDNYSEKKGAHTMYPVKYATLIAPPTFNKML